MAGNVYDYGFRIYNPQIAKFLSVDPLTQNYPWYTPYQFAGNRPIDKIDLDGLEEMTPEGLKATVESWKAAIEKQKSYYEQLKAYDLAHGTFQALIITEGITHAVASNSTLTASDLRVKMGWSWDLDDFGPNNFSIYSVWDKYEDGSEEQKLYAIGRQIGSYGSMVQSALEVANGDVTVKIGGGLALTGGGSIIGGGVAITGGAIILHGLTVGACAIFDIIKAQAILLKSTAVRNPSTSNTDQTEEGTNTEVEGAAQGGGTAQGGGAAQGGGGKNAKKMSPEDIGDFLKAGKDWHKGSAKKDFLKQFKKELKGDTNADFYVDKTSKEVFLKSNKSNNWINTGQKMD